HEHCRLHRDAGRSGRNRERHGGDGGDDGRVQTIQVRRRAGGARIRAGRLAGGDRESDGAGRRSRFPADSHWEGCTRFLERRNACLRGHGIEPGGCGRSRPRAFTGGGTWRLGRALYSGEREPDAGGDFRAASGDYRQPGAPRASSLCGCVVRRRGQHGVGQCDGNSATGSAGRGQDGQEEDVCLERQGEKGAGIQPDARGWRFAPGGRMVSFQWLRVIVFLASEKRELSGLAKHLTGIKGARVTLDYAQEAQLRGEPVLLAANGSGFRLAREGAESIANAYSDIEAFVTT